MVQRALQVAGDLEKEGISVEVIDPRTLVPLDEDAILASVAKTNRLVIVHEAVKRGGFGAEIAAMVSEKGLDLLDAPIARLGAHNGRCPTTTSSSSLRFLRATTSWRRSGQFFSRPPIRAFAQKIRV